MREAARRIALAVLASVLMAGPSLAAPNKHVTIGLSWIPQAEHCGFFQAVAKGSYTKRGLDVVLQPGGPEVNNGMLLASGRLDFALTDMLAVLRLEVGKVPAVAVGAYYQKDPQTIVVHPNDGIETLADLKGHPLMIAAAQRNGYWQWLKAKYGLDDGQLKPYSFTSAGFIADPHSGQQGYITNDGYVLGSAVPGARSLLLADAGYPNYGNVLMAMQQTVKSDPEMVQAVVDGSAEGWLSCVAGDFAGAKDAILAASPSTPPALFDYSMKEANERSLAGSGKDVGMMTDARWTDMYKAMNAVGVLPDGLDYKAAYTLQFVDKIGAK